MGWVGTRRMSGGCVFRGEIDVLITSHIMVQESESVVRLSLRIFEKKNHSNFGPLKFGELSFFENLRKKHLIEL